MWELEVESMAHQSGHANRQERPQAEQGVVSDRKHHGRRCLPPTQAHAGTIHDDMLAAPTHRSDVVATPAHHAFEPGMRIAQRSCTPARDRTLDEVSGTVGCRVRRARACGTPYRDTFTPQALDEELGRRV